MLTSLAVQPYDLGRQPALRPEAHSYLRASAREFARAAAALMGEYLGTPLTCEFEGLGNPAHEPACGEVSEPCAWVAPEDEAGGAIWRLSWPLADALLDGMLGCATTSESASRWAPTELDACLLGCLCCELGRLASHIWAALPEPAGATRCSVKLPTRLASGGEWAVMEFRASTGPRAGRLALCVPLEVVRAAHEQARGCGVPESRAPTPTMCSAPVTAHVRLGIWRTSVVELMELEVGQVVELGLSPKADLPLSVGGSDKLMVRPGQRNGHVSVQVIGPCEE